MGKGTDFNNALAARRTGGEEEGTLLEACPAMASEVLLK
jgi:hypothetical protein